MMKNFAKKENLGITLIALVVTIIVLIILAGVTISLLLSENDLITKARLAKENYEDSSNEEKTDLDSIYSKILVATDGTVTINYDDLNSIIDKRIKDKIKSLQDTIEELQNKITTLEEKEGITLETGTNSNGTYYKFSDGTLICTKHIETTVNITTSAGGLYSTGSGGHISLGAPAINFVSTPIVSATLTRSSVSFWLGDCWGQTATSLGSCRPYYGSSKSNAAAKLDVIAIGRWK